MTVLAKEFSGMRIIWDGEDKITNDIGLERTKDRIILKLDSNYTTLPATLYCNVGGLKRYDLEDMFNKADKQNASQEKVDMWLDTKLGAANSDLMYRKTTDTVDVLKKRLLQHNESTALDVSVPIELRSNMSIELDLNKGIDEKNSDFEKRLDRAAKAVFRVQKIKN